MLRVIKKNFKPARHPDATNADDHDEGHNFINIEEVFVFISRGFAKKSSYIMQMTSVFFFLWMCFVRM